MINVCPWGYNPNDMTCPSCKYLRDCVLYESNDKLVVLNGTVGVWRKGSSLILENTSGQHMNLLVEELDSYVALLQAAQQELAA